MASNVQKRTGKRGTTYRVEIMRNRKRISKTFKTRKEAEDYARLISENPPENKVTVKDAFDKYWKVVKIKDQKGLMNYTRFWVSKIGNKSVSEVTHKMIDEILSGMEVSDNTKLRYRSALSQAFEKGAPEVYNRASRIKRDLASKHREWFL